MNSLTFLERAVLEKLLLGNCPELALLREQSDHLTVNSREMTGVGFCTDFSCPPEIPRLPDRGSYRFGDVAGETNCLQHGIGFVLTVDRGAIAELEGYTYDEPWPPELGEVKLTYLNHNKRELNGVCGSK